MTALQALAIGAACVASLAGGAALCLEPQSEERLEAWIYAGLCGVAAAVFLAISWWIR